MKRSCLAFLVLACLACWAPLTGCASKEEQVAAHVAAGKAHLEAGEFRDATVELRSALKLDPTNAEVNFLIGRTFETMARIPDAVFFYREAARLDPGNAAAGVRLASLLIFDEQEEAAEILDAVLDRDPSNAQAYMIRSRLAVVQEDLGGALQAALTATQLDPEDGAAFAQLGKVYQSRIRAAQVLGEEAADEEFRKALQAFDRASQLTERAPWLSRLQMARVYIAWNGHEEDAKAVLRRAFAEAQQSPNPNGKVNAEALRSIRAAALSLGQRDLEKDVLDLQVSQTPGATAAWLRLAAIAPDEEAGDAVMARMLEARAHDANAHAKYALYLRQRGRSEEAFAHLEQATADADEPAAVLVTLLQFLRADGRDDEAAAVLARLEADHAASPDTSLMLAQRALVEGRNEDAAVRLRELVGVVESVDGWRMLAEAEGKLGRPEAAIAAVDRSVEVAKATGAPFPRQAINLRARLQYQGGDWRGALRSLNDLERNGVTLTDPMLVMRAHALYMLRRVGNARRVLKPLLDREPPYVAAVLVYAQHESKRRPEETRELVVEAHARHPANPGLVALVVRQRIADEDVDGALEALNVAIASGRATPTLLEERAQVFAALGRLEEAQRDALTAFEFSPGPRSAALLVALYKAEGRIEETIASFEEAEAVGALKPGIQVLLARLHLSEGNVERARELYESALAERSDLPLAKNDLAYMLAREKQDLDRALVLAQEAQRGLPKRPEAADTLGFVYLQKGLSEPAVQQFRYAIELSGPEGASPVIHYHLGLALRNLGRSEEAVGQFQRALEKNESFAEAAAALEELEAAADSAASAAAS